MQNYKLELKSEASKTFRCQKAAQSSDIDVNKKLTHSISIDCDIETDFHVGLILGASGSGKTTLARHIFPDLDFESIDWDENKTILDNLDEKHTYTECSKMLASVGLNSPVCWIRPLKTLSNGQKSRAEIVYRLQTDVETVVIDEFTSVVDRLAAKVMSIQIKKIAKKLDKRIILLSCHYDIIEWLDPDWIIDCNQQSFEDRRLLRPDRQEKLTFDIRECSRKSWKYFSKYHYLSSNLPGGTIYTYGLFYGNNQIGFTCFANYVPGRFDIFHSNRVVIHPDYQGFGLGLTFVEKCCDHMNEILKDIKILAKFSSIAMYKARIKSSKWDFLGSSKNINAGAKSGLSESRKAQIRSNVMTYRFQYKH